MLVNKETSQLHLKFTMTDEHNNKTELPQAKKRGVLKKRQSHVFAC